MAAQDATSIPFDQLVQRATEFRSSKHSDTSTVLIQGLCSYVRATDWAPATQAAEWAQAAPTAVQLVECITGKLDMIKLAASPAGCSSRQYGVPAASSIPLCGLLPALQHSSHSGTKQAAAALAVACLHTAVSGSSQRGSNAALRCVSAALRDEGGVRLAVYQCVQGPSTSPAATPLLQHAWKEGYGWLTWGLGPLGAHIMWQILQDAPQVSSQALQWALRRWGTGGGHLSTPQRIAHVLSAISCLVCAHGLGGTLLHVLGVGAAAAPAPGRGPVAAALPLLRSMLAPRLQDTADIREQVQATWQTAGLLGATLQEARTLLDELWGAPHAQGGGSEAHAVSAPAAPLASDCWPVD